MTNRGITAVAGLRVGHFTETRRPTGCTVVLADGGAVAGVDVRGAAPGTRETELLAPLNTVDKVHAVLLAGGSAFGLDAAGGVMRFGIGRAMRGGLGSASLCVDGVTVGALVAVNAIGDVVDPATGAVVAGARTADGSALLGSMRAVRRGDLPAPLSLGSAT